jgi:hypothetical protein
MDYAMIAYAIYLPLALAMTVWVARTLHKNGRVFLLQAFHGREDMADSVNHLLVVGFYLINLGFITATLCWGKRPLVAHETVEFVSTKLGITLLVLGAMHFFNMFNFDKMRRKGLATEARTATTPPVIPSPRTGAA